MKSLGIQPKRTSFRSPWQSGVVERWVGNCRRDLLNHVIVLNERHLKRLMNESIRYWILLKKTADFGSQAPFAPGCGFGEAQI